MVINDLNVEGISIFPAETHPPLSINTDAVLPDSIPLEQFQPIVGGDSQIVYTARPLKLCKFTQRNAFDIDEPRSAFALEQGLGVWAFKRLNHYLMVTDFVNNGKRY